ncbi:MAG: hypothetical protein ACTSUV_03495 [Candidatus Ranarchaeia archaeon]
MIEVETRGLRELWGFSKTISEEVMFQSIFGLNEGGLYTQNDQREKLIKKTKQNLQFSKFMTSFLFLFLSITFLILLDNPFGGPITNPEMYSVTIISSYFLMGFFFIMIFGIMNTTTFVSSGAIKLLSSFPINKRDFNSLILMSFFRMLDIPIIVMVISFPIGYLILTSSVLGSIAILLFSLPNLGLSIGLMVGMSKIFSKIQGTGGSKIKTILRFAFNGLFFMSYFLIYQIPNLMISVFLPLIINLSEVSSSISMILSVIYPFSFSYVIRFFTNYIIFEPLTLILSSLGTIFYLIFFTYVFSKSMDTLRKIVLDTEDKGGEQVKNNITIITHKVTTSLILKDLILATRKQGYFILFLFPFIMIFSFSPMLLSGEIIRTSMILGLSAATASFFIMFSISFLSIESLGIGYTLTLPLKTITILKAKALFQSIFYLLFPLVLFFVGLLTQSISNQFVLVSGISLSLAVFSGSLVALSTICKMTGNGRIVSFNSNQNCSSFFVSMFIGGIFILFPLLSYALTYFSVLNHILPTGVLILVCLIELPISLIISRKITRG